MLTTKTTFRIFFKKRSFCYKEMSGGKKWFLRKVFFFLPFPTPLRVFLIELFQVITLYCVKYCTMCCAIYLQAFNVVSLMPIVTEAQNSLFEAEPPWLLAALMDLSPWPSNIWAVFPSRLTSCSTLLIESILLPRLLQRKEIRTRYQSPGILDSEEGRTFAKRESKWRKNQWRMI